MIAPILRLRELHARPVESVLFLGRHSEFARQVDFVCLRRAGLGAASQPLCESWCLIESLAGLQNFLQLSSARSHV